MSNFLNLSKQIFLYYYIENKQSTRKISEILNIDRGTVKRYLKKYGIKTRSLSESRKGYKRSLESRSKQSNTLKNNPILWKKRIKNKTGIENYNYKHGKYIANFCVICNKKISPRATKCIKCANKNKTLGLIFKNCGFRGKGDYYKNCWMRSSWEIAYAKYLDKNNISWLYEPKAFLLKENKSYRPDFFINNDTYVEIKGWMTPTAKLKIDEFIKLYPKEKFIILTEKELKQIGVL